MVTEQLQQQLQNLPTDPGIYKYFDVSDELIYVGKAVNLKNRVKSYFVDKQQSPKTRMLVSQIDRLETIVVQSEIDALILEANLIKQHQPRFNIILKDDKSHLYIKITLYEDLPRVSTCRATDLPLDPKATYFGPYPSSGTVKRTLRFLRRVFGYVARHQPPQEGRRRPPQSFFYFNLPLGEVDSEIDKKKYRQQIFQLVAFLEGKRQTVANDLEKEMKAAAKKLDFETAAQIKQQLDGIAYVTQFSITPEMYVSNPELISEKREQGLQELAEILGNYFPKLLVISSRLLESNNQQPITNHQKPLHRVECYDISNISGTHAVGSMVVFEDGEAKKSDYRKFRIKMENKPNDFAMMQEVLGRRFKRLKAESLRRKDEGLRMKDEGDSSYNLQPTTYKPDTSFESVPDLIVIDGGKGQLTSALAVLDELGLDIPVVGMTKREEELVVAIKGGEVRMKDDEGKPFRHPGAPDEIGVNSGDRISYGLDSIGSIISFQDDDRKAQTVNRKPNRSSAHAAFARTGQEAETLITSETNFSTIRLARGSDALFFIQRLRDEAHRFAITYHRKLRSKAFLS